MPTSIFLPSVFCAALALSLCAAPPIGSALAQPDAQSRFAQLFNRPSPPANMSDEDDEAPPRAPDNNASVRIDRLENQLRSMTGQIEQLQYSVRKLEEQLRNAPAASAAAPPRAAAYPAASPATGAITTTPSTDTAMGKQRRGDAFDPDAQPSAAGAPRQIGAINGAPSAQTARLPSGPMAEPGAPLDLSGTRGTSAPVRNGISASPLPSAAGAPAPITPMSTPSPAGEVTPGGTIIASQQPFGPREEYDLAVGYLKGGQYEAAEKGFSAFLAKNPKNRLVPEAIFNLGESYFQRSRQREAAEQYLKISTTFPQSAKAPEAMLRLGESLGAFGAKEQACAAFSEIPHKYPNASPTVRAAAEREAKKNQC